MHRSLESRPRSAVTLIEFLIIVTVIVVVVALLVPAAWSHPLNTMV